jgi:Tfp pilus assembly protein PilO
MRPLYIVWQENWRSWAAPLALMVLGLGALVLYQARYSGRVAALDSRIAVARQRVDSLAVRRAEMERAVQRASANRQALQALYSGPLAPQRERLTRMIAEVKQLAARAGMRPDAISYPIEEIKDYGLVKKSLVFGVGGTYAGLRQLINFLELSSSFLTLEQVSLGDAAADGSLAIRLQISTLFTDEEPRQARASARRTPSPSPPPSPPRAPARGALEEGP